MDGIKFDKGKIRHSLLPWDAIRSVVEVMEYGAKKYGYQFPTPKEALAELVVCCTCARHKTTNQQPVTPNADMRPKDYVSPATQPNTPKLNPQHAIQTVLANPAGCAESATRNSLISEFPDITPDTPSTQKNGTRKTKSGKKNIRRGTGPYPGSESESEKVPGKTSLLPTVSHGKTKSRFSKSKVEGVPSAGKYRNELLTSTTATDQKPSGDSCVENAIKDSGSWMTVWKIFNEHSTTCKIRQHYGFENERLIRSGAGNWQKLPEARVRYFDAAQRHLIAWYLGESNDPESGLPHLAHCACCILYLLWFQLNPPGE